MVNMSIFVRDRPRDDWEFRGYAINKEVALASAEQDVRQQAWLGSRTYESKIMPRDAHESGQLKTSTALFKAADYPVMPKVMKIKKETVRVDTKTMDSETVVTKTTVPAVVTPEPVPVPAPVAMDKVRQVTGSTPRTDLVLNALAKLCGNARQVSSREIAEESGLPHHQVLGELLVLDCKKLVQSFPGKMYLPIGCTLPETPTPAAVTIDGVQL